MEKEKNKKRKEKNKIKKKENKDQVMKIRRKYIK